MNKTYLTHDDIFKMSEYLIENLKKENFNPDRTLIIAVARGGLIPAGYISYGLNLKNIQTACISTYLNKEKIHQAEFKTSENYSKYDNIIIVDDIHDSGDTIKTIVKTLAKKAPHCDLFPVVCVSQDKNAPVLFSTLGNKNWIVFPWDKLDQE